MDAHLKSARQARKGLEKVRKELLDPSPESLERCVTPLQLAIGCMEQLAEELAEVRALGSRSAVTSWLDEQPLRTELFSLRRDLSAVSALLGNAARFYSGYAGLLGIDAPGSIVDYSPAARVATPRSERPFLVHG